MTPSKGQDHVTPPPTVAGTTSVVAADNNDNNNTDLNRGSWTARLALRPRERDDESLITSLEDSQQQRRGYTGKMVEVSLFLNVIHYIHHSVSSQFLSALI